MVREYQGGSMTNFKTYLVTAIELDWDDELDEEGPIDEDIKKDIVSDCLGEWFAYSEDHLIDNLSDTCGFCIKSLEYKFIMP
jgi:hypothetical protein